ncbi:MAG: TonB C-terminal domain-containing protein [Bdellovibrionales bacterium]|nr:TonB C-terminal domain-containing protein [Bdellovibrionales bacterium]
MTYRHEKSLSYFTGISFLVHILIFVVFFLFSKISKNQKVEIIEVLPAVRVDVVAMPKLTLQELKNIKIREESTSPEKAKDNGSGVGPEYLKKAKKRSLMDLLKRQAKKKVGIKPSKVKSNGRSSGVDLSQLILEGNKISKGSAIIGTRGSRPTTEVEEYVSTLPDFVRPHWKLPSYLINEDLNCRIRIYLNSTGHLIRAEVYKSSGNKEYDQRAMNAINRSQFPTPKGLAKDLAAQGKIVLGFPL